MVLPVRPRSTVRLSLKSKIIIFLNIRITRFKNELESISDVAFLIGVVRVLMFFGKKNIFSLDAITFPRGNRGGRAERSKRPGGGVSCFLGVS
jgi:hypothetical protein